MSEKNKMINFVYNPEQFTFIVGPCSLESLEQMLPIVDLAKKSHIKWIRAPLFKPRTHPDSFQGLGVEGLYILSELKKIYDCHFVTEVMSENQLDLLFDKVQMLQIGARNMQNFELLKSIGKKMKDKDPEKSPKVLLKRGFQSTIEEWQSAGLYLERYGVHPESLIYCERGGRNFTSPTGVVLDFALALEMKKRSGRQVFIDPSHGTAKAEFVLPMVKATQALGLDGVMIEIHPSPKDSVSDAKQAVSIKDFAQFLGLDIFSI